MPEPIGGIQPFAELARGRATVVYKGYQRDPGRFVLLKVVRPEGGEDEGLVERFEEEARFAAQVRHPNVVAVLDAGRDGLGAYLVTEFVEGLDLRALTERGAVPPALAAYVLTEAARGLGAVHAQGILHRDLKPANLLLSEDGEVKLADFGLASLAPSGGDGNAPAEVRGTLAYLAPEIVRGDPPGEAADLFSLGAILVEMLTGRPVFARDTPGATLDAVLHHDATAALQADPRIPPALAALAGKLLAKDPQHRLADEARLIDELEAIRVRYPAEAADLAGFLRDPSGYVAPLPVLLERDEAAPVGLEAVERGVPSRRVWWGVAAGVVALAVLGLATMLAEPESERGTPQEVALRDPVVTIAPDSTAGAGLPPVPAEEAPRVPDDEPLIDPEVETGEPPPDAAPADPPTDDAEAERLRDDVDEETPPIAREPELPAATAARSPEPVVVEAAAGTLLVVAEPWARIRIDGEPVGTTPLAPLTLAAGPHAVTFENPEFPPHTVRVDVSGGAEERVAVSLWSLVGRVELVVSPWAEVAVDGEVWDTVPPQERPLVLAPGEHRLSFTHPTLGTWETTLRIAAGESRTLRVNLAERLQ